MGNKTYFSKYNKISSDLFEKLKKQYSDRIAEARDWKTAHNLFNDSILSPQLGNNGNKLRKLGTANNFSKEWNDIYQLNKSKDRPEIFNELVEAIESTKRTETVKLLGEQEGLATMLRFLGAEYRKRDALHTGEKTKASYKEYRSPINWIVINETEFVQLIYALHEAKYIEHEEREITKLVESFARLVNYPLGKNWQINLSTSIHKRNSDYIPPIFDNLKEAYKQLRSKKIEKKKKI